MLTGIIAFITDWRKIWKPVLVLGVIVGAFCYGRYSKMCPAVETTHTTTIDNRGVQNTDSSQNVKIVTQYVDRPVDRVITKTIIKEVGGKVTETTVDDTHQGNTTINTVKDVDKDQKVQVKTETVYKDRDVIRTIDKEVSSKWSVGAGVGYGLTGQGNTNYIPSMPKGSVVNVQLNHKVFSWLKGGVWANSRGDAGVQALVEF